MAFIAARSKRFKRLSLSLTPAALAALAATSAPAQEATLPAVVVTSPANRANVSGFGEVALSQLPMQASVISASTLIDRDVQRLADMVSLKASVSDAYNAAGYWDMLAIRGFALDNRHNFKRDGLPINAETLLPLDNKERVEILEGLSGMQTGLSAPGGLVNLVVKRPDTQLRSVTLGWEQSGSVLAAADLSQRFGPQQAFGLRLNVAYQHLDPQLRDASGKRQLLALAGDWRLSPDTLIEAEVESSRRSQRSQPGFSLLGSTLPDAKAIDPRINLNNQPWSLPVVMAGHTGSLRVSQALTGGWKFVGHYAHQELRSDDRLAYPYGCSAEGNYDRYCSDGSFDYYLFRSDGEHRRNDALQLSFDGQVQTGPVLHNLNVGLLSSYFSLHTNTMPDDGTWVGNGSIDGATLASPLPVIPDKPNTNRTERSNELFVRDRARLAANWTAWLGLRSTRMTQTSIRTDGSRAIAYSQDFATPWLALSHDLAAGRQVYASWGQGIETAVTPNKGEYLNPGQVLPAVRSHQWELGYKARYFDDKLTWNTAYFNIHQPNVYDNVVDAGYVDAIVAIDGQQRRQGLETDLSWSLQRWRLETSAMLLDAKLHGSSKYDGNRPTNVPELTLKAQTTYRVPELDGLQLMAGLVHEGGRMVLPDNSVSIPAWTRLDLGLRHEQRLAGTTFTWRAGLNNATDKRAWRESPYQYGHAYLYPLAPRTWRLSLQTDL
jgi:iron complex outermembrane recepter protein